MNFLLDTQLVLWILMDSPKLSATCRTLLLTPGNRFHFSVVNIWEIAIKHALGRAGFRHDPRQIRRQFLDDGFHELPVLGDHVLQIPSLPPIHKDPFDRILIAQALVEGIILLTADPVIAKYPGPIRKL